MSMLIAPDTAYGKELWKWENEVGKTHPQDPNVRGMRAPAGQPYPAMMYKATQKKPWKFDSEIAKDENAQRNLESRGYVAGGRGAAADAFDAHMKDMAQAAAHRNHDDRHISEQAREEVHAAEQASSTHLGEIPRTPIKKRAGRPKKASA